MNVVKKSWMAALAMMFLCFSCQRERVYDLSDYGLKPDSGENASPLIAKALQPKLCRRLQQKQKAIR